MTPRCEDPSPAGYRAHQRRGEKPCRACKVEWNKYIADYRRKNGRK
jgi:hypothetical protein